MTCFIDWCALTWEAFATLVAGGAAVGGATLIGLRQLRVTAQQASIAERQADILAHQVEVDRAKLRADLFDRRFAVYRACKQYMRDAMTVRGEYEVNIDIWKELMLQLEQAEFLFAGEVRNRLREVSRHADMLLVEREELSEMRRAGDNSKAREQGVKVRKLRQAMSEMLSGLSADMGEEMKLYIPRASEKS